MMLRRSDTFRWLGISVLVVFVCLLLTALVMELSVADELQVEGELSYDAAQIPYQMHEIGEFRVEWKPEDGGQLAIAHQDARGFALWSSMPGHSFVAAGQGEAIVRERRGHFEITDRRHDICPDQSIENIRIAGDRLTISGTLQCRGGSTTQYLLVFTALEPNQLGFRVVVDPETGNRTYLTYASQRDEHFYGFGEQFSYFDLKGKRLPIYVNEQGIGRGLQPLTLVANTQYGVGGAWYSSYAAVPHYITSQLRSLFLENSEYAVFDMRMADRVQIQVFAPQMEGRILHGGSPAALIAEYTSCVGRMRPLPDWLHEGAIVSLQGGTARVRGIVDELVSRDIPISGIWIQDWVGQRTTSFGKQLWWNWELDEEWYPRWDELCGDLADQNIKLLTYINPFLVDVSARPNFKRNLFAEAADQGFLVENVLGAPYLIENSDFSAGLVDLSNPAAFEWMRDVVSDEVIARGVYGWMVDFGEGLPYDAALASAEPAQAFHNRYPEEWARLNREALDAQPNSEEMFFFMRSGYSRSPEYSTAFWLGDQLVSWDAHDGIKTAVTGLLSSGLSGYALNHSDIGGYTSIANPVLGRHRSDELLKRWMELNAFTTIYRTHESNRPDENVQVYDSAELLTHFERFARVYRAWGFYRRQLVLEAAETGMPVVRHMFLHFPEDHNVYGLSYEQFMVGDEFIVAPVLDPGVETVTVYLPEGRWVHLWTGDVYASGSEGSTTEVDAPLGQPGVFYRQGSSVAAQFLANLRTEGVIE